MVEMHQAKKAGQWKKFEELKDKMRAKHKGSGECRKN
jgi:hypothetical protein